MSQTKLGHTGRLCNHEFTLFSLGSHAEGLMGFSRM